MKENSKKIFKEMFDNTPPKPELPDETHIPNIPLHEFLVPRKKSNLILKNMYAFSWMKAWMKPELYKGF